MKRQCAKYSSSFRSFRLHCNVLILGEKKLLIDPEIDVNLNENKRNYESATTPRHARLSKKNKKQAHCKMHLLRTTYRLIFEHRPWLMLN